MSGFAIVVFGMACAIAFFAYKSTAAGRRRAAHMRRRARQA